MKTFKQHISESKNDEKELHRAAQKKYEEIASDLPRSGDHHYNTAHDVVSGHLYDSYHKSHPHLVKKMDTITSRALKPYGVDDRAESRANDKRRDREYEKRMHPKPAPVAKPKAVKVKNPGGYNPPLPMKPRKGIGSS
jgi:hypothetical protein